MRRRLLLELLDLYERDFPAESATVKRFRDLVSKHADCFERTCLPGHITGSAWILSADHRSVLLTHHRKLDRWLQLGGHADGEGDPFRVALREAEEESGLTRLLPLPDRVSPLPLDLDVHAIPARPGEPAHFHHDVRYLLVAAPDQPLVISEESHDLRWVARDRLSEVLADESQLRMDRKARRVIERLGRGSAH